MRILLITLSNIGDLVLTTPVLELLHRRHPDAVVDVLADRRSCQLIEACPYVGAIILRDKKGGWRARWDTIRTLRQRRYELVVDLRTDGLSLLLRCNRAMTRRRARPIGPHAVERHLGVVHELLVPPLPTPRIWLSAEDRMVAGRMVETLPPGPWLAIAPGANWSAKRWPKRRFTELAETLAPAFSGLVLVGGPADEELCAELSAGAPLPAASLAGRCTLRQTAAALGQCAVFVGNDSGTGHIAAAMGIATVTVFGPGEPERYRPWGERSRVVRAPGGDLALLAAAPVADTVRTLLAEGFPGPRAVGHVHEHADYHEQVKTELP